MPTTEDLTIIVKKEKGDAERIAELHALIDRLAAIDWGTPREAYDEWEDSHETGSET